MVSSTCYAPAANGKRCPAITARGARCIATFRSGRSLEYSASSGNRCCNATMPDEAYLGVGKVSTALKARRRSAGKKTGKNPTDRGKLGVKRSVLTDGRG